MRRFVKRALAAVVGLAVVFTVVVGFAHTRAGRPLSKQGAGTARNLATVRKLLDMCGVPA